MQSEHGSQLEFSVGMTNRWADISSRTGFVVFTIGDARKPSTWSNVPYFFTRTLEEQGFPVQRVNIAPSRFVQLLFDLPWKAFCKLIGRQTRFTYLRSRFNRRVTNAKIARALKRYPDGHCVFMTFSFSPPSDRAYTMFCDQTFAQHIAYFDERQPDDLEIPTIVEERRNLRNASLIIALFPDLAESLKGQHGDKVKYYGNVVNIDRMELDADELLARKRNANEIVFIGNRKYKEGLERLAEAVGIMNKCDPKVTVNVIGMDRRDLPSAPPNMKFHGYLDKGDPAQRQAYLEILGRSRLFVNPNPKWAAFSASCEALYLYTPVVIFPYGEFERTFGDTNDVGQALTSVRPSAIAEAISSLLQDDEAWSRKANAAHEATKWMTWDNYIKRYLLDLGSGAPKAE